MGPVSQISLSKPYVSLIWAPFCKGGLQKLLGFTPIWSDLVRCPGSPGDEPGQLPQRWSVGLFGMDMSKSRPLSVLVGAESGEIPERRRGLGVTEPNEL